MKKGILAIICFCIMGFTSVTVFADPPVPYQWDANLTYHKDVYITGFSIWKNNSIIFIKLDNGSLCYIANDEKDLYTFALALYSTGKPVKILSSKLTTTSYGGFSGERLHQMWN